MVALPTPRPQRDQAQWLGAIVPIDSNNRALKKLLALLRWDGSTQLVARVEGNTTVVERGAPTRAEPWLSPTQVDDVGRLTLPPGREGSPPPRGR